MTPLRLTGCALSLSFVLATGCPDAEPRDEPPRIRPAAEYRSDRVDEALDHAVRKLQTRGATSRGEEARGFLAPRATHVADLSLASDECEVVLASATPALRDLELRAYDSDGNEIARDEAQGPNACLELCASHAGTFYVVARAASGTGLFAARRLLAPTGVDVRCNDVFDTTEADREPAPLPEEEGP